MMRLIKISNTYSNLVRSTADFLRYTFTPAVSALLAINSLGTLTIIAIVRHRPTLVLSIFCGFMVIFSSAMVVNFFLWRRYRKFYNSVFKK